MAKQIIQEQRAQNHQNTYEKVRKVAEELNIIQEATVTMKKSGWKRRTKDNETFRIKLNHSVHAPPFLLRGCELTGP